MVHLQSITVLYYTHRPGNNVQRINLNRTCTSHIVTPTTYSIIRTYDDHLLGFLPTAPSRWDIQVEYLHHTEPFTTLDAPSTGQMIQYSTTLTAAHPMVKHPIHIISPHSSYLAIPLLIRSTTSISTLLNIVLAIHNNNVWYISPTYSHYVSLISYR